METFVLFSPLFIVILWITVCYFLSKVGGWGSLSKYYKCNRRFDDQKWHMQSLKVNMLSYRGCVTFGANHKSVFASVMVPFRIGAPNLEIPLSDICGAEEESIFTRIVSLTFLQCPDVTVNINKKLADRIEMSSDGNWRYRRITNRRADG